MKIAIYVYSWPPGIAPTGIVTYTSQLVPALRRMGHEVYVVTSEVTSKITSNEPDPYTLDVMQFWPKPTLWSRIAALFGKKQGPFEAMSAAVDAAVAHLVKEHGVEVFEMEESFGWTARTSKRRQIPVVVRLHGPWFLTGRFDDRVAASAANQGRAQREGEAIAAAHMVTANCADTLGDVREHYGLELATGKIIPTPIVAAKAEDTWSYDACEKDTILFLGRFDRLKGADLVLRVFERLAASNPRLRLTFVGPDEGIAEPDGTTLTFEPYFEKHFPKALRSRIDFRGRLDHAEVMAIRKTHYMTLIAAQFDTFGYMLLEPMSLGCPVVTTAVGGIPEAIKDRHNGLLVPSQDDDAMVAACEALLADPELAARIGHQAWQDCREKYNADTVAAQTFAAYEEAVSSFER